MVRAPWRPAPTFSVWRISWYVRMMEPIKIWQRLQKHRFKSLFEMRNASVVSQFLFVRRVDCWYIFLFLHFSIYYFLHFLFVFFSLSLSLSLSLFYSPPKWNSYRFWWPVCGYGRWSVYINCVCVCVCVSVFVYWEALCILYIFLVFSCFSPQRDAANAS